MHTPIVATLTAGLLGLVLIALSARVVMGRTTSRVMLGSGETAAAAAGEADSLFVSIRSQANFAEYVPLCLLLIAGLEIRSGATVLVKVLAAVLVIARLAHPVGMTMKAPNPFRAGGFVGTMLVLAVASVAAIAAVF